MAPLESEGIGGQPRPARHVFICGYPRSGTTMFYNMLRATVSNFRFLERETPARLVIGESTESIISKRPLDIFDIDEIVAANRLRKQVGCIILIRDVRAIVTSRHKRVPDDYFVGFDHQYYVHAGQMSFTNPGILQIHGAIATAWQRRDIGIVVLRYEDILRELETTQSRLGHTFGLQYQGSFRDFHKYKIPDELEYQLNRVRPPDVTSIDAWKGDHHRARIRDQFTRCPQLFDILKAYGYEKDDRWFDVYREETPAS